MIITSGTGREFAVGVTSENQLEVCAVTRTIDLYCNQINGISYSLLLAQTPTGAGDCFSYLKNNDANDMIISSIKLRAASDETFFMKLNDTGTPVGGSAAASINRKAGCGNVADVTCEVGNDITGLSGGDTIESIFVKGGEASRRFEWYSCIIVPKNHVVTLYVTTGAIAVTATVSMHFCECL
jgi:hypothetical protein